MRGAIAWSARGSRLEKGRRSLILSLTLSAVPEPASPIPPVSRPLTWPVVEPGAVSQCEPRKSQTQAPLPTRPTDASGFDNPTAGGSFIPVPAVTPLALDTSALSRQRARSHPLRRPVICPSARCHSRHSTLGAETIAPPFSTSPLSFRPLPCGDCSDTPFSAAVLAGTAGWQHLLSPGGTALLCFPVARDPPSSRSLPKNLAIICPGRKANFFCDIKHNSAGFKP
jgi:hypothetical protein